MSFPDRTSPPKGYVIDSGRLEPDRTVAGYLARGRELYGRCEVRDCRRSMHFDFARLAKDGLGAVPVYLLKPVFRCSRLGGCALDFYEKHGDLTLGNLTGRDHVGVRLICGHCKKGGVYRVADVVEKLKIQGTGGYETKVDQLAELIKGVCPKCGLASRWEVAIMWGDTGGAPTWRVATADPTGRDRP